MIMQVEMTRGLTRLERGKGEGSGALKLLREEFSKKREPKRMALSAEQAIDPLGQTNGKKLKLQNFLEKFLAKN